MGQKHRPWRAFLFRFNRYLFWAQCEQVYLFLALSQKINPNADRLGRLSERRYPEEILQRVLSTITSKLGHDRAVSEANTETSIDVARSNPWGHKPYLPRKVQLKVLQPSLLVVLLAIERLAVRLAPFLGHLRRQTLKAVCRCSGGGGGEAI